MEWAINGIRSWQRQLKVVLFIVVGLLLFGWLLNTPPGLLGKADAVGYAVCHRIDGRSFHLGDRAVPLCARCSGMYLGAMLGLAYQVVTARRRSGMPPLRVITVLAALVLAFGIDGLNSYLHLFPGAPGLYEPQNWSRLLTGSGMGLVIAAALYPAFNQSVWQRQDTRAAISGLGSFGILVLLALVLDAIVLLENPLILYPLALISAAGVLVILSIVYAMVGLMLLRLENHFQRVGQLVAPLTFGFGAGITQILLLDLGRYLLTGTWDGFHLG